MSGERPSFDRGFVQRVKDRVLRRRLNMKNDNVSYMKDYLKRRPIREADFQPPAETFFSDHVAHEKPRLRPLKAIDGGLQEKSGTVVNLSSQSHHGTLIFKEDPRFI